MHDRCKKTIHFLERINLIFYKFTTFTKFIGLNNLNLQLLRFSYDGDTYSNLISRSNDSIIYQTMDANWMKPDPDLETSSTSTATTEITLYNLTSSSSPVPTQTNSSTSTSPPSVSTLTSPSTSKALLP